MIVYKRKWVVRRHLRIVYLGVFRLAPSAIGLCDGKNRAFCNQQNCGNIHVDNWYMNIDDFRITVRCIMIPILTFCYKYVIMLVMNVHRVFTICLCRFFAFSWCKYAACTM